MFAALFIGLFIAVPALLSLSPGSSRNVSLTLDPAAAGASGVVAPAPRATWRNVGLAGLMIPMALAAAGFHDTQEALGVDDLSDQGVHAQLSAQAQAGYRAVQRRRDGAFGDLDHERPFVEDKRAFEINGLSIAFFYVRAIGEFAKAYQGIA